MDESSATGACVQYGCGLSAPADWINFDASPTLRAQRLPLVGSTLSRGRASFPPSVRYGDVVKGLPIRSNSCRAVYASHVLEHLALADFAKALKETLRILQPGGTFRLVVPDLQCLAARYLRRLASGDSAANSQFLRESCLGREARPRGVAGVASAIFGNSTHLWMWDEPSMVAALKAGGFTEVRRAHFNDSAEEAFRAVEEEGRFIDAVAAEARKPSAAQARVTATPDINRVQAS